MRPTATSWARSSASMMREDPTFRATDQRGDRASSIISGMGELHLEVIVNRIQNDHKCEVADRQAQGRLQAAPAQRARDRGALHPPDGRPRPVRRDLREASSRSRRPRTATSSSSTAIKGGSVPREYIPKVENGLREGFASGGRLGYPFVNVRATLFDGKTPRRRLERDGLPRRRACSRSARRPRTTSRCSSRS